MLLWRSRSPKIESKSCGCAGKSCRATNVLPDNLQHWLWCWKMDPRFSFFFFFFLKKKKHTEHIFVFFPVTRSLSFSSSLFAFYVLLSSYVSLSLPPPPKKKKKKRRWHLLWWCTLRRFCLSAGNGATRCVAAFNEAWRRSIVSQYPWTILCNYVW